MNQEQRVKRMQNLQAHYSMIAPAQLEIFLEHARGRKAELDARSQLCEDEILVIGQVKQDRGLRA